MDTFNTPRGVLHVTLATVKAPEAPADQTEMDPVMTDATSRASLRPAPQALLTACMALIVASACSALADDGSMETVGGAVRLMKDHGGIRMVSEVVRARVSLDRVDVDCMFVMKNEGPTDTVLVGFPDGSTETYGHEHQLEDFRSWVDGVEATCDRVAGADSSYWWTKRVVFPRKAMLRIRNCYTVSPSWLPNLAEPQPAGHGGFGYVLWTGASWKGTIGLAEIVATVDGIPLEWITGTSPEALRAGRTFRWAFRDFEPGSSGGPERVDLWWKVPSAANQSSDTLRK